MFSHSRLKTGRTIKIRISEHLRTIRKFSQNLEYSLINLDNFQEIAIHFNESGHTLDNFKFCVIESNVTNPDIRKSIETDLINLCLKCEVKILNVRLPSSDKICYFTFQNKF